MKTSASRNRIPLALTCGLVLAAVGCASGPAPRLHVRVAAGGVATIGLEATAATSEPEATAATAEEAASPEAGGPEAAAGADLGRPGRLAPGGWLYPLAAFRPEAVISPFGASRDGGARRHEGIDIRAPRGTGVLAPVGGRVIASRRQGRGGNIVVLVSDDGELEFVFAHLDARRVSRGQRVRAGDVLGTVGNTGNARGMTPHLHFEVHMGRRPVDPYPLLASR